MKHKNIVITGTSRGLGRELAEFLSKDNRVIGLSRSKSDLAIEQKICDVSNHEQVNAVVADIVRTHGPVDVLINNAAVLKTAPLALMSAEDILAMVQTNLLGVIWTSRAIMRPMMKARFGRIINIISMSHKLSVVGDSVYAATKAGVEAFAKILNKEGHSFGITVNNIGLSAMQSGMLDQITKDKPDQVKRLIPHGQYAELETMIQAITYFCGEGSQDIGGQSIYLGGI